MYLLTLSVPFCLQVQRQTEMYVKWKGKGKYTPEPDVSPHTLVSQESVYPKINRLQTTPLILSLLPVEISTCCWLPALVRGKLTFDGGLPIIIILETKRDSWIKLQLQTECSFCAWYQRLKGKNNYLSFSLLIIGNSFTSHFSFGF